MNIVPLIANLQNEEIAATALHVEAGMTRLGVNYPKIHFGMGLFIYFYDTIPAWITMIT